MVRLTALLWISYIISKLRHSLVVNNLSLGLILGLDSKVITSVKFLLGSITC